MRILVTGVGGFVGAHVVQRLLLSGHQVVSTARGIPSRAETNQVSVLHTLDLAVGELATVVNGCDAIVHCAARASPWGPYQLFFKDNVIATQRLISAAREAGVRRFIHLSTPSIYFRFRDEENLNETFAPPAHWVTHYAETKWTAECSVLEARDLGPIALRPRAVFGPGDRAIVPRLLSVAKRGFFPLPNGGAARIDVTCIANLLDAIELALAAPSTAEGQAYNISNGVPINVRELLQRLFHALKLRVRYLPVPRGVGMGFATLVEAIAHLRPGAPEPRITRYGIGLLGFSQTLDISKARLELGYQPKMSFDDGLEDYVRWWKSQ
jgi:nucleoside-diphosphate-sugar epimerase